MLARILLAAAFMTSALAHATDEVEQCVLDVPTQLEPIKAAVRELSGIELVVDVRAVDLQGIAEYQAKLGDTHGTLLINTDEFCGRTPEQRIAILAHELGHGISYARSSSSLRAPQSTCLRFGVFGCTAWLPAQLHVPDEWNTRDSEVEATGYAALLWKRMGRTEDFDTTIALARSTYGTTDGSKDHLAAVHRWLNRHSSN